MTLGQWEEDAIAGRWVARVDRAWVVIVTRNFLASETNSFVAMIVLRARIAVVAAAARIELVTTSDLGVARVDCARVTVVAIERGAHARTRCFANVTTRAVVLVVARDRLAVRCLDDRFIHAEARNLCVAPILGAGIAVVAVDQRSFAGAGGGASG